MSFDDADELFLVDTIRVAIDTELVPLADGVLPWRRFNWLWEEWFALDFRGNVGSHLLDGT